MFFYLIIINIIGFTSMILDKFFAKNNMYRIPEKVLFLIAVSCGSLGIITGMYYCRHKTKHKSFVIGIPIIMILNIVTLIAFICK